MKTLSATLLLAVLSLFSPVTAETAHQPSVLERSEEVVGRMIENYRLVDQDGNHLAINSLRGKTVLLNFMYIDCPDMCILIAQSLEEFVAYAAPELEEKFTLVSVSINPVNDTPQKLHEYGLEFTESFDNWHFTTTDVDTLEKMVGDLGFDYQKNGDQMEHLNRVTLIGPDGTVTRHFYGTEYDPKELEESINAVMAGQTLTNRLSGGFSKFLLYCSNYDPTTKTYRLDYKLIATSIVNYILIIVTVAGYWYLKKKGHV